MKILLWRMDSRRYIKNNNKYKINTNDVVIISIKFLCEGQLGEEESDREETDDTNRHSTKTLEQHGGLLVLQFRKHPFSRRSHLSLHTHTRMYTHTHAHTIKDYKPTIWHTQVLNPHSPTKLVHQSCSSISLPCTCSHTCMHPPPPHHKCTHTHIMNSLF